MIQDLRFAFRSILREKGLALFSILSLALGLGLNGSLLVLSRTFLLSPAPVANPGTLLEVIDEKGDPAKDDLLGSTTAFAAARELPEFESVALASSRAYKVGWRGGDGIQDIQGMDASAEYLALVGIRPYLGRGFLAEESAPGRDAKVVLVSYRFWKQGLQGRKDILGQALTLDGQLRTVVGVLPPGFGGHRLDMGADVMLSANYEILPAMEGNRLMSAVLARLRPGVTLAMARARLASLPWSTDSHLDLQPYHVLPPVLRGRLTRGLAGLHGAAFMLLAIAVCNVLAIQGARLHKRKPELALRVALGARSGHLLRLLLAEHLLLAILAGLVALGLAAGSSPFLEALQAILPYPPKIRLSLGLWSAGATFGLALLVGVILTFAATWQTKRLELAHPLQEAGLHSTATRARGVLVAVQAALSLALLSSATLCLRDLRRQMDIPLGYELKDRFELTCDPRGANRPRSELAPLMAPLRERITALPGVRATALTVNAPMGKGMMLRMAGGQLMLCTHEMPSLLGLKIAEGRSIEGADEDHERVLVNALLAGRLWPGQAPLGRHAGPFSQMEVVGVFQPVSFDGPNRPPIPVLIKPVSREEAMFHAPFDTLMLHLPGSPLAVRNAVRSAARDVLRELPFTLDSIEDLRDERIAQPRQLLFLSALMGALALVLSLCGLYGLATHLAEHRKRELGIRVALGAGPGRILAVLAKGSLLPLVPGMAAGVGLSLAVSRILVGQNEGFAGIDPVLLAWTCLVLSLAAALACLIPAIRTALVDPAETLRSE